MEHRTETFKDLLALFRTQLRIGIFSLKQVMKLSQDRNLVWVAVIC